MTCKCGDEMKKIYQDTGEYTGEPDSVYWWEKCGAAVVKEAVEHWYLPATVWEVEKSPSK